MKKLLLILLCLSLIFTSCNTYENKLQENDLKAYNQIVKSQLARDTIITDIFMGLKYGDSEYTTRKKLRKLLKEKKLSSNNKNKLEYEFAIEQKHKDLAGKVKAIVDVKFHKDKLYQLTLRASPDRTVNFYVGDELALKYIHTILYVMYHDKYFFPYKTHEMKNSLSEENLDNYLIYANNQIKISTWLNTDITYTDLRVLKEIEIQEKKEKEIEASEKERMNKINDI